ncbi:MAG TPA: hypothetical protein VGE74_30725 [Gemmata sp.]
MTAIGKLLAFLILVVGLTMMTWAVGVYVQRPGWFNPIPEGGTDKGSNPATFAELKAEIEVLNRSAQVASGTWGDNLKALEEREQFRAERRKGYAERVKWMHTGNPKDLINPANPKSGVAFYGHVVDPTLRLDDLTVDATGKPKGEPILGDVAPGVMGMAPKALPLPGLDGLATSVAGDVKGIEALAQEILDQRKKYDALSAEVIGTEQRLLAMNTIRDSVQAELFFLSTFEVNVYETRETVVRRERQLRNRLRSLGVSEP